jgi:hypothetical protein
VDINKLPATSLGGNTYSLDIIDEYTGHLSTIGMPSKSATSVLAAITSITSEYNAKGHRIYYVHADPESTFAALNQQLSKIGITVGLSPPGQHQQRFERHKQTWDGRIRATLDALPYHLPPTLYQHLRHTVAYSTNFVPNSLSAPNTPHQLRDGTSPQLHYKYPYLRFGTTCMVPMGDNKRSDIAQITGLPKQASNKAEIAVCLGYSGPRHPKQYLFLLENNQVVIRNNFKIIPNVIPFGWKAKPQAIVRIPTTIIPADDESPSIATPTTNNVQIQIPPPSTPTQPHVALVQESTLNPPPGFPQLPPKPTSTPITPLSNQPATTPPPPTPTSQAHKSNAQPTLLDVYRLGQKKSEIVQNYKLTKRCSVNCEMCM